LLIPRYRNHRGRIRHLVVFQKDYRNPVSHFLAKSRMVSVKEFVASLGRVFPT
jgi:hypothetical protein